jgi:hypothetical protein
VATSSARRGSTADPMLGKVVAGRYRLEARLGEGRHGRRLSSPTRPHRPRRRAEAHSPRPSGRDAPARVDAPRGARRQPRRPRAHHRHPRHRRDRGGRALPRHGVPRRHAALGRSIAKGPMPIARASTSSSRCAPRSLAPTTSASSTATSRATTSSHRARWPQGLREDPRLRPRGDRARPAPRAEGRGLRHARVHVARAGARRGPARVERPLRARRALLRDADGAAPVPLERSRARCSRCSAPGPRRARAASCAPTRTRRPSRSCLRLLEKDARSATVTLTISKEELKALQRSSALDAGVGHQDHGGPEARAATAPPRRPPGVVEWAAARRMFAPYGLACVPGGRRARGADSSARRSHVGSRRACERSSRARSRPTLAQARGARATRSRAARRDRS